MTGRDAGSVLGLDPWGMARLVESGELTDPADRDGLSALHSRRARRRTEALGELARIDGPHLSAGAGGRAGACANADTPGAGGQAVFLDACILASAIKRHLVLGLAEAGLIYPRWSQKVLFETGHAHARIVSGEPGRDGAGEAARIITALEAAFPEAMVPAAAADQVVIEARLPDPDDAHVMRAAKAGEAALILTDNMKDFPRKILEPLGLYARPTAEYLGSELSRRPDATRAALLCAAARLSLTPDRFKLALHRAQLGGVAKRLGL